MKTTRFAAAVTGVALALCAGFPAKAQQAAPAVPKVSASALASTACLAPNLSAYGRLNWFLGLNPSDDLMTAWCRIQALPGDAQGDVRFNILWPTTGAHKSWNTTFRARYPAERVVQLIQSVIPKTDASVKSDSGVPFSDVLANVVQLEAGQANDNSKLGFAPSHPAARQLVLWEPLALRIKPVVLAGQNFTLSVFLRPNLGLLALALSGKATDVRIEAWSGRFQLGNYFRNNCSPLFPECKDLKPVEVVHMPLLVDTVRLEATGENMTASAVAIGQQLYLSNPGILPDDPMKAFNTANGTGTFTMADADGTLVYDAQGVGGTKSITINYKVKDGPGTLRARLGKIGDDYRAGTATRKEEPKGPDALGNL